MTRFYTKTGDDGYTSFLGQGKIPKYDQRIETIGAIDEANAAIALARTVCANEVCSSILFTVQKDLYHAMSEIAATPENAARFRKINAERVGWLEQNIDDISSLVNIPDEFIIPGDSQAGAVIDLVRTIVRRAERHLAYLNHKKQVENPNLLHYFNRLSSLCFVLELLENQAAGKEHPSLAKE